ncbi:FAD-dependent oxidoreductase [Tepidibacter aestuarii]|uniref:FAD-dependent oxidoreductase n=1 Tax=Tepidibacter aestuarii TaxID=2925782 RepID=UPI0020BFCDA9|nr:FAD-dependent oxidoreductase [Tepidibacter aestuarii]CAH2214033.1 NADH oxidase [Tepidibacter aestuarii]
MKIAVIGCTHAGTASILSCSKLYPDAKITVYEKNDNISFLSCGIALYVGGVIEDPKGLFYSSPEELTKLGVITKMSHEVLDVDIKNKKINIINLKTNERFEDDFDKLIITTGSWPIIPNIDGIKLDNILLSKNFYHSKDIIEKSKNIKNVVVVGAGYIGVELVEAFQQNGKNVTLIDAQNRILNKYLDEEYTSKAEEEFVKHSVNLELGQMVQSFKGKEGKVSKVVTDKGEYDADLVIMCVGFKPNTHLFKDQIEMLDNGAIIVDEYMRTSEKDIYAAGDCCAVIYNPTNTHEYIPLATNAVRMGTLVARNLVNLTTKYMGTQGTSGIKIYDYNIASTGLTYNHAKEKGIDADYVVVEDNYRPEFMPTYEMVKLKVVYDKKSQIILGAQIISKADLTQSINTMSVFIQNKMTMDELAFTDFFFQPHFNKPWNILNSAGLKAK